MYNKAKKTLGLVSGILAILVSAFAFGIAFFAMLWGLESDEIGLFFMALLSIPAGIFSIIFGAKQIKMPIKIENKLTFRTKVYVVIIIFMSALTIMNALSGSIAYNGLSGPDVETEELISSIYYIFAALAGASFVLSIVAASLKSGIVEEQVVEQEPVQPEVSDKIAQLNALKENGTITEEQYKESVEKLLNNFVK